jgi:hypothetical protein
MKTTHNYSLNFNPSVPKPRTFSQTQHAPAMSGQFGSALSVAKGTTRDDPRSNSKGLGPLSVPRSGCCGK